MEKEPQHAATLWTGTLTLYKFISVFVNYLFVPLIISSESLPNAQ